ncbi:MAG: (Fe-S)-binding protein, partial [Acidimicrobiia bacterium]|nr:(Fe-S)-binding protein [Acidimicrobiia bacterium]
MTTFVTRDAPGSEQLNICVACGLCLPHCPTFRLTGRESASPRGRLAAMLAVFDGEAEIDAEFDEAMSFCLQCMACQAACPGLVPYGRAMEGARAELVEARPTPARRVRGFLLGRVLRMRILIDLGSRVLATLQRIPVPKPGRLAGLRRLRLGRRWYGRVAFAESVEVGTVGLLSGCVMDAWFGPVHDATVGVLQRAGYRVVVPEGQTCCGALAAHDGQADAARAMAARNAAVFGDVDLIVSDAAGCTAHLKDYDHWAGVGTVARVRDATELVAELIERGQLPTVAGTKEEVAIQDPCHLRHAQLITAAPRDIVRAAGYKPVEIDPDGLCCGAAGVYMITNAATSNELGRRKADQVRGTAATIVA